MKNYIAISLLFLSTISFGQTWGTMGAPVTVVSSGSVSGILPIANGGTANTLGNAQGLVTSATPTITALTVTTSVTAAKIYGNKLTTAVTYTTSHTLTTADEGQWIYMNSASTVTVTVPTNSVTDCDTAATFYIKQTGAGQVVIVAESSVTINSYNGFLKIAGQFGDAYLRKDQINTWSAGGNLTN